MKEFTIAKNDAGQRLDRWLAKTLPLLPAPLAQKYIRLKRVKVNGKGSKRDQYCCLYQIRPDICCFCLIHMAYSIIRACF